jgi:hypothetical protein
MIAVATAVQCEQAAVQLQSIVTHCVCVGQRTRCALLHSVLVLTTHYSEIQVSVHYIACVTAQTLCSLLLNYCKSYCHH